MYKKTNKQTETRFILSSLVLTSAPNENNNNMWDELVSYKQERRTIGGLLLFALGGKIIKTSLQRYSFGVRTIHVLISPEQMREYYRLRLQSDYPVVVLQ